MTPDMPSSRPSVPPSLLVAAVLVALQGLAWFGFGIAEAVHTTGERAAMGASTALFFVAFGAGLVLCAWGLSRISTWARGPVLLAQLISLGLAWNFRDAETVWASVGFGVPAALVLGAMLHPRTIAALEGFATDEESSGESSEQS